MAHRHDREPFWREIACRLRGCGGPLGRDQVQVRGACQAAILLRIMCTSDCCLSMAATAACVLASVPGHPLQHQPWGMSAPGRLRRQAGGGGGAHAGGTWWRARRPCGRSGGRSGCGSPAWRPSCCTPCTLSCALASPLHPPSPARRSRSPTPVTGHMSVKFHPTPLTGWLIQPKARPVEARPADQAPSEALREEMSALSPLNRPRPSTKEFRHALPALPRKSKQGTLLPTSAALLIAGQASKGHDLDGPPQCRSCCMWAVLMIQMHIGRTWVPACHLSWRSSRYMDLY